MTWKKEAFKNFKLYAVTNLTGPEAGVARKVQRAYLGGADIVQLRSKNVSDRSLLQIGACMRELADGYGKLFFVNDRPDLAIVLKADGLHLGQDDMPIAVARRLCRLAKAPLWIGKSTHSLSQALEAQKEGADYIGVGPIFGTPTKPDYKPVGLDLIRQLKRKIKIPFVVIGGIDETNLHKVLEAGATRVAFVRAIFQARDIYDAAKKLRRQIEDYTSK